MFAIGIPTGFEPPEIINWPVPREPQPAEGVSRANRNCANRIALRLRNPRCRVNRFPQGHDHSNWELEPGTPPRSYDTVGRTASEWAAPQWSTISSDRWSQCCTDVERGPAGCPFWFGPELCRRLLRGACHLLRGAWHLLRGACHLLRGARCLLRWEGPHCAGPRQAPSAHLPYPFPPPPPQVIRDGAFTHVTRCCGKRAHLKERHVTEVPAVRARVEGLSGGSQGWDPNWSWHCTGEG